METVPSTFDFFPHVRILMGAIVGLGMTRLLMTFAGIIQHARPERRSSLHLLWLGSILLELILFWWWEVSLADLPFWTFGTVLFVVLYAITLFLLAAFLAPDNIAEYRGYEDFFIQRRHWFFGILGLTFVLDAIDTTIKGGFDADSFDWTLLAQVPFGIPMCIVGWYFANRSVQLSIVGIDLLYQIYLIVYYFNFGY